MAVEVGAVYATLGLDTSDFEKKLPEATKRLDGFQRGMLGATQQSRAMQFAVTNLSFQVNDVVTGLVSGQRPFQVFAQQAGQFVQLFQQGGGVGAVLKETGRTLRGWVTPTTLAVGGITALATGVGVLVARNFDAENSAHKFDVVLKGLGVSSRATGAELEASAKRLRDVGLSASEAREKIIAVSRAGLNPARAENIIRVGKDVEAVLGGNGIETVTGALAGGLEGTIKLGLALNALTANEISAWREMARLGQAAEATEQAFKKIAEAVKGADRDALTPFKESIRDLTTTWQNALDSLSQIGPIMGLTTFLTTAGRGLDRLARGDLSEHPWLGNGQGEVVARAVIPKEVTLPSAASNPIGLESALAAIARHESGNRALIGWGNTDLSGYPLRPSGFPNWPGKMGPAGLSTAAGLYQITRSTWEPIAGQLGITDFSEESQKRVATELLRTRGFDPWKTNTRLMAEVGGTGDPRAVEKSADVTKTIEALKRLAPTYGEVGAKREELTARIQAGDEAAQKELDALDAQRLAGARVGDVWNKLAGEQKVLTEGTTRETAGMNRLAGAYDQGITAGQRMEAQIRAESEAFRMFGTVSSDAAKAFIKARSDQLAALNQSNLHAGLSKETAELRMQIDGLGRVADAYNQSTAAGRRMEAQVRAETEAVRAFGTVSSDTASAFIKARAEQLTSLNNQVERINFARGTEELRNQVEILQLENSLFGKSSEEISRQIDLLRVKQQAQQAGLDITDKEVQARLKEVNAIHDAADALKQKQAVADEIKEIGNIITNNFEKSFDAILEGTFKVKEALRSLLMDLGKMAVRKGFDSLFDKLGGLLANSGGGVGVAMGGGGTVGASSSLTSSLLSSPDFSSMPKFADGGSFRVGGVGAVDSKIVQFRATPGEMVDVRRPGADRGGSGEVIRLELTHSDAFVGSIADQRIRTHSGTIVDVAVRRSRQVARREFADTAAEMQARQA